MDMDGSKKIMTDTNKYRRMENAWMLFKLAIIIGSIVIGVVLYNQCSAQDTTFIWNTQWQTNT